MQVLASHKVLAGGREACGQAGARSWWCWASGPCCTCSAHAHARARTRVYLRDCVRTAGAAGCRKRLHAADRRLLCSATELLRTCAVGSYGPKDLPRVAHAAGRTVGNAVAFLKKVSRPRPSTPESLLRAPARSLAGPTAQARSGVDSFAKEHELLQLHQDVRKSLMELNSIRSEIQQVSPRERLSRQPPPWSCRVRPCTA